MTARRGRDRRSLRPQRVPRAAGHRRLRAPSEPEPSACDDGPFGKGTGGQLRYSVTVPAGGSKTAVGRRRRLRQGPAAGAERARRPPCSDPRRAARGQDRLARAAGAASPGSRCRATGACKRRSTGASRTSPTSRRARGPADPLDQPGQAVPAARGVGARARRWVGAGFPDYPWIFATDGEYTAFAARRGRPVRGDQGPPARAARHLRHPQRPLGRRDARGGLGRLDLVRPRLAPTTRPRARRRTTSTPTRRSSSRAPSRSSGAGQATTPSATRCTTSPSATCATSCDRLDDDDDGWPEGSGQRRASGHGRRRSSTTAVYLIRGLYDLADMARSKHDGATFAWARNLARKLHDRFETTWWMAGVPAVRRLARRPRSAASNRSRQHWIGQTPMEAELHDRRAGRARARAERSRQRRRWPVARTTASAASARSTSACSTPAARGGPNGAGRARRSSA